MAIPVIETPVLPQDYGWGEGPKVHETSPDRQITPQSSETFLDGVLGGPSVSELYASGNKLIEVASNRPLLNQAAGNPSRYLYASRNAVYSVYVPHTRHDTGEVINSVAFKKEAASLAVQSMYGAYSQHVPYSMRPDTFWYMIVHEVAEHVRQNPGKYARLFTTTPGAKQTIVVEGGNLHDYMQPDYWAGMADRLRPRLESQAGLSDGILNACLPRFSTSGKEDEAALLVAFMDAASPYYGIEWRILCGIPQVRLEGEAADWQRMYDHAAQLASLFSGLRAYFDNLLPVLQTIAQTAAGTTPDEEFWRSIFQYNGGCGDPKLGGWMTAFFAYVYGHATPYPREHFARGNRWSPLHTDEFPSHISKVPFMLDVNGDRQQAAFVGGITGVDYDDTFLTPRLGYAVAAV